MNALIDAPRHGSTQHDLSLFIKGISDALPPRDNLSNSPIHLFDESNDAFLFESRGYGKSLAPEVAPPKIARSFANTLCKRRDPACSRHFP